MDLLIQTPKLLNLLSSKLKQTISNLIFHLFLFTISAYSFKNCCIRP